MEKPIEITEEMVEYHRKWMGQPGIAFFRRVKGYTGEISCVLTAAAA